MVFGGGKKIKITPSKEEKVEVKSEAMEERDIDFDSDESTSESANVESMDLENSEPQDFDRDPPITPETAELEAARVEASENYDKYLRALADLENYKKRAIKDRSELLKYEGERLVVDFLDVVDDFERALQFAEAKNDHFRQGVELIYKRLLDILARREIRGESSVGKPFDPNLHNAISRIVAEDVEPGMVVNELKKAYYYKDKLIRHGEVVVSAEPPHSDPEGSADSEDPETSENVQ